MGWTSIGLIHSENLTDICGVAVKMQVEGKCKEILVHDLHFLM
jgi:hypothetical protein